MVRVTNGLQRQRKHKKYLSQAKWFRQGRKGLKYSTFMNQCYTKDIELNRKVLSNIAVAFPEVFNKICDEVTK